MPSVKRVVMLPYFFPTVRDEAMPTLSTTLLIPSVESQPRPRLVISVYVFIPGTFLRMDVRNNPPPRYAVE